MKKGLRELLPSIEASVDRIWTRLAKDAGTEHAPVWAFSGIQPEVGTSVMAASTALRLAQQLPAQVLLVEADYRRPSLASYLSVEGDPGLARYLSGEGNLAECAVSVPDTPGLTLLAARSTDCPGITPDRIQSLVKEVSPETFIIFDAGPVLECPETRILLANSDGVILVLRARKTRKDKAQKALEHCEAAGAPVLGTILNRFRSDLPFGIGTP